MPDRRQVGSCATFAGGGVPGGGCLFTTVYKHSYSTHIVHMNSLFFALDYTSGFCFLSFAYVILM